MNATRITPDAHGFEAHSFWNWAKATFLGPRTKVFTLVAGAVVLWASWPALAQVAAPAPPLLVLGLSALIGCLASFCFAARSGNARGFASIPPRTMAFVAFGLMGNNAFYLLAISRIGPAEANVVHYLWPVFLVLLVAMIHRRAPTKTQISGVALGFCGVTLALSQKMGTGFDTVGVLLGACGALTFALYSAIRSLAKVEADVVGPSLGLAGLVAIAAHVALEPTYWPSAAQWGAIALMGLGPFTIANILWDKATRQGATATISSFAFLTPLVAMGLLSLFSLGEVTLFTLFGAGLTILGALLGSRK